MKVLETTTNKAIIDEEGYISYYEVKLIKP